MLLPCTAQYVLCLMKNVKKGFGIVVNMPKDSPVFFRLFNAVLARCQKWGEMKGITKTEKTGRNRSNCISEDLSIQS